jgi:hypothetical protein
MSSYAFLLLIIASILIVSHEAISHYTMTEEEIALEDNMDLP